MERILCEKTPCVCVCKSKCMYDVYKPTDRKNYKRMGERTVPSFHGYCSGLFDTRLVISRIV